MINGKIIKVCGMKEAQNIQNVDSLQEVDMIGFIFFPRSPRFVSEVPAYLPASTQRVGVFVDESMDEVSTIIERFGLNYIQLHGKESPEYCRQLKEKGHKVIKAFSIACLQDFEITKSYKDSCDYFLFDTKSNQYGGSGIQFDWNILQDYKGEIPFLLSGGIDLQSVNALQVINHPRLAGFDINSRFEIHPGQKDIEKIRLFLHQLKSNNK